MKTIKFGDVEFKLVYDVVEDSTAHIRITVHKENFDILEVADAAHECERIVVYEDGVGVKVYENFTELDAVQLFKDYPIANEEFGPVYSIELTNADIQSQLDALLGRVNNLEVSQELQSNAIGSLEESQEVQDGAIEDLGEAVSALEPIEEG